METTQQQITFEQLKALREKTRRKEFTETDYVMVEKIVERFGRFISLMKTGKATVNQVREIFCISSRTTPKV
jgi:hypothetical protein